MVSVEIKYLGNKIDTKYNGFFNALGKEASRNEYILAVQNEIKNLQNINEVINAIKVIEDKKNVITPNTVFIITINKEKYYLSNVFKQITKDEFEELNFVPYIKFNKSNCDIDIEENRVNKILRYKNSDDSIKFIKEYIKELPKSFKTISDKPHKVFLNNYNSMNSFKI